MTQALFFALIAVALFGFGLYGFFAHAHVLRKILALNVMGNAVFMLLVAIAARDPIRTDPVPHAMVLTGIVIAVSATAFALVLARRYYRLSGVVGWDAQGREIKS
jgi:multicomponent Na+:H+ antiporter subunit C